jgi:hypothetical protein
MRREHVQWCDLGIVRRKGSGGLGILVSEYTIVVA